MSSQTSHSGKLASEPAFGIASLGGSSFVEQLPEYISVEHVLLRTPAEVISAARKTGGRLVLFSNFTFDENWKRFTPAFEQEIIDHLIASNHPDARMQFRAMQGHFDRTDSYEASKQFYGKLLSSFRNIELHVMTCASRQNLSDEEIVALAPGRIHVRRLSMDSSTADLIYAMDALKQHGIPAKWIDSGIETLVQRDQPNRTEGK